VADETASPASRARARSLSAAPAPAALTLRLAGPISMFLTRDANSSVHTDSGVFEAAGPARTVQPTKPAGVILGRMIIPTWMVSSGGIR